MTPGKHQACNAYLSVLAVDVDPDNCLAKGWVGRLLQVIINMLLVLHGIQALHTKKFQDTTKVPIKRMLKY